MTTGLLIKNILKKKGKKQKWLAEQLNIPTSSLSTMLKNDLKFSLVIKICEILQIELAEVLEECEKNEMSSTPAKKNNSSQSEQSYAK